MQSFEFQADTTVSLVSPAAISRKSCDHCFLNRKTCDKVRESADSGEKCRRCAKDNRPCTFTPTVHLYHIADCVGRHQCRAKVVQAMGGRKKDVQFKTIEIPIVCDMDSALDLALFDFIQKQPNLLVYNNRIKSFLAQDMLGVSPDYDGNQIPSPSGNQSSLNYPLSTDAIFPGPMNSYPTGQAVSMNGAMQNSHRHRVRTELDRPTAQHVHQHQHQHQQQRSHPYAQHQRSNSDDRGRHAQRSPRAHPASMVGLSNTAGRQSPNVNVNTNLFSPIDQRRHSDLISPVMSGLGAMFQQQHPYAQQSPYPQALQFQPSQPLPIVNTQYRTASPFPPSPVAPSPINSNGSPHPPSPLELAIGLSGSFGGRGGQQGLAGLFDTTLTMSTSAPQPFHQRNQNFSSSSNSTSLASPSMASDNGSDDRSPSAAPESQPMVITTVNEDGNEVGVYYAVPQVNLNPAYQDADLFQDFTMMDSVGEDFVWIENLFEDDDQTQAMSNMATSFAGDANVKKEIDASPMINGFNASSMSSAIPETASMADFMLSPPAHGQQGQEWASQYQTSFSIGGGHSALTPQG